MISIFIMFSPDRMGQFYQQMECMEDMEGFDKCQKTLLVDGTLQPNEFIYGFDPIEVERKDGDFCWANMWEAGVASAKNDVILYLDSDRVLPNDYLTRVMDRIEDNKFLFCESMFNFKTHQDTSIVKSIRDLGGEYVRDHFSEFSHMLDLDPRFQLPLHGWGKGPMSGNTAFTRATYEASGGVDPWYCGHGAYADTDFHKQCCELGMVMEDMGVMELHLHHIKLQINPRELSKDLSFRDIEVLSLNNLIYHCKKWDLGYRVPKGLATHFGFSKDFVDRVLAAIDEDEKFVPITR